MTATAVATASAATAVTKDALVGKIVEIAKAKGLELTKKDANELLDSTVDAVVGSLEAGQDVRLNGLGTLRVKTNEARAGRNPRTGEPVQVPARKTVKLVVADSLKDKVALLPVA